MKGDKGVEATEKQANLLLFILASGDENKLRKQVIFRHPFD
jgi:hypothetical protein